MKRLLVLVMIALAVTACGSAAAREARKVGAAFMAAAAAGDAQQVQSMLSARADMTAQQVVDTYKGLTHTEAFDVKKPLPNDTGVQYLVLASGLDPTGRPRNTTLAVTSEHGRWLIVKAGSDFTY